MTMVQQLKEMSRAANLNQLQKEAMSYAADCIRHLEETTASLEDDKRGLGKIIDDLGNQVIQLESERNELRAANTLLTSRIEELEEKMAGMRTIEEVHQIISLKAAGLEVQIEYWTPEQDDDGPYVYRPTW